MVIRIAVVALTLMIAITPSFAGVGEFGIFTDAEGNNCALFDPGAGALITTYVVHRFYGGDQATGSRFGLELSAGVGWQFLLFQSPFGGIPSVQGDISLSYGSCITSNTSIGSALWLSPVGAPTCSTVSLKPADSLPTIVVTDCAFNEEPPGFTNFMVVNSNGTCWCYTATRPATWGSVKALYR